MTYLEKSTSSDPIRPGEQWFFYWKTSPALWEGKIMEFPSHEVIFLPLYWGLHAESQTEWDFGQINPEKDLLRLSRIMTQHGRKFCWIMPLSPAPFFPNGGMPVYSARSLSVAREGVHLGLLDQEMSLHKMYSFFEPKVFQAYAGFVKAFGAFLGKNKIAAPVWGGDFYYFQDGEKVPYFDDYSVAFEQGFSRYLKSTRQEKEISNPDEELNLKKSFSVDVSKLFSTTAEECLGPFWQGIQPITVLGGSPKDTILRSVSGGKSQLDYTRELFRHFVNSEWISSALLTKEEKKESLSWILSEHFGSKEIEQRYHYETYKAELTTEFRPFGVVDIFEGIHDRHFERTGLISYLDSHFKWLYQKHHDIEFTPQWIDLHQQKIKFFHGGFLNRTSMSQVLKLFMMGQTILLDRSGLSEGLDKKLHIFLIENNIKTQVVNYMTETEVCELGEGKLIIFAGDKLTLNPTREKFWNHIFKFLKLIQPEMSMDDEVFSLWRIRATTPHELSYLDIRRVNLYNPTSYKKLVSIRTQKHFAFMKMIDPTRATAKSTPDGVDVELLPNGKVALDFGHYEEG